MTADDQFPPEEAARRFEIALRAACFMPPRDDEERRIRLDIAERNKPK